MRILGLIECMEYEERLGPGLAQRQQSAMGDGSNDPDTRCKMCGARVPEVVDTCCVVADIRHTKM